ncbi:DUF3325 family protein [Acetobacter conturbans]|uniref:DUF3325 family protein n=1 Tax=Acetobacter conturbans TaxID=1737472 RepID=A0ABX0K7X3_9PROT|nr:DUF3325 family protein [Acetobacter conturbans]NHN89499.1 DUF3325 family protein [Acetobacter conturbans]
MMSAFLFCTFLGLLLFLAFALLALTQFPHRRVTGTAELLPRRVTQVRLLAGLLLVVTLGLAIWNEGGGFGFLLWASLLSLTACAVAFVLGWWAGLLVPLARVMLNPHPLLAVVSLLPGSGRQPD